MTNPIVNQWTLAELLPHSGDVILLDEITEAHPHSLTAHAVIRAEGPFHDAGGTLAPAIGLEIMAQAVAAWAGLRAKSTGQAVRLGFLLGTRHYDCSAQALLPGQRLTAYVERSFEDASGIGLFACTLSEGGHVIAQGRLTFFCPESIDSFLDEPVPSC